MLQNKTVDLLSEVKLFQGLTSADIGKMAKSFQRLSFSRGQMLLEEGGASPGLNIITDGELKVFLPKEIKGKSEERISEITLNHLKAGDWFGEYSTISDMRSSSSIQAVTSGELLHCSPGDFKTFLASDDRIAKVVYYNILQQLLLRFRERESEYDCVLVMS